MINRYDMRHVRLWPINNTQWPESHDRNKSALRGPKSIARELPEASCKVCVKGGGLMAASVGRVLAFAVLFAVGAVVTPASAVDGTWTGLGTEWNTGTTTPIS